MDPGDDARKTGGAFWSASRNLDWLNLKHLTNQWWQRSNQLPSSKGTSNIHAAYAGIFGTIMLNISFETEEIEVDNNMAMAVTSSKGTVTVLAQKLTVPEANRELFVFRKQDENWKIYRYMFNKSSGQSN